MRRTIRLIWIVLSYPYFCMIVVFTLLKMLRKELRRKAE